MTNEPTREESIPPYAAINRLVEHVLLNEPQIDHWRACEEAYGPSKNKDHIVNAAWEVQCWLDANLMTWWSLCMLAEIEGRDSATK
jgi:hypothetical protein